MLLWHKWDEILFGRALNKSLEWRSKICVREIDPQHVKDIMKESMNNHKTQK
jgi:hypothetical protein